MKNMKTGARSESYSRGLCNPKGKQYLLALKLIAIKV